MFDNVMLPFAYDEDGNFVTINKANKENKYLCVMCGEELIVRQGSIQAWHFAHTDKSKCSLKGEAVIHWWCKNMFLKEGDSFTVKTDRKETFICKRIDIEVIHVLDDVKYKPDITITTDSDEKIFVEVCNTNKKRIKDYINIWNKFGNIVVEVDIKDIMLTGFNGEFKSVYYDGIYYEDKDMENVYNSTIGIYKSKYINSVDYEIMKLKIEKLDWIWKDICAYKMGLKPIDEIAISFDNIEDKEQIEILCDIFKKNKCNNILKDYMEYKEQLFKDATYQWSLDKNIENIVCTTNIPRLLIDRMSKGIEVKIENKKYCLLYDDFIHKDDFLNQLDTSYKENIIKDKMHKIIEKINSDFLYKNEKKVFSIIERDRHEVLCLKYISREYETDKPYNIGFDFIGGYDKYLRDIWDNILLDESEIIHIIKNKFKSNNIPIPLTRNEITEIEDSISEIQNNIKNKYQNKAWCVNSHIGKNKTIKLSLNFEYSIYKNKCYEEYIINIFNKTITIKSDIYSIDTVIEYEDYNDMCNMIIKHIENKINSVIIIDDYVFEAIDNLKKIYSSIEEICIKTDIMSPEKLDVEVIFGHDKYKYTISDNFVYKNKYKILELKECTCADVTIQFKQLIDRQICIDCEDISKRSRVLKIISCLNRRLSNLSNKHYTTDYLMIDEERYNIILINKINKKHVSEIEISLSDMDYADNIAHKIMNDNFCYSIQSDRKQEVIK